MKPKQQYFPVFLTTIRANLIQTFDIFIKLKGNIVLYHSGGDNFTSEVRKKLIENKVGVVYIPERDKGEYNNYLVDNLSILTRDNSVSMEDKTKILHYSVKTVAHQFFNKPDIQTIPFFKNTVSKMTDLILLDDEVLYNLVRMASNSHETYIHSINVGVFGTGLAKFILGNDSKHDIKKISEGLFFHDIGKTFIPPEIINKNAPLNHNEWNLVKQHPLEGYKILNHLNTTDAEIKIIVMQHHERNSGKGYPMGLKGDQIHLYSKICSIADSFEALTSSRPYRNKLESSFNALLILKNEMMKEIDPDIFQQFVKLFSESAKKPSNKTTVTISKPSF
ncbi:HD-GYP domain-containing protein [Candidatus Latescibacterota bacterium]